MPFPNAGWNKFLRKSNVTKEELEDMYLHQGLSQKEIADILGVQQTTVGNYMRKMGIPTNGKARSGKKNGSYKHGRYVQYRVYRQMIVRDKCAICGTTENLLVHHKNFDSHDNHLENLQVLCSSCHTSLHKTEYWRTRK